MTKGYIFDYGGTLDTGGQHWGKVIWHAYERQQVPVTEALYREAYVHAERTLGKNPIIQPNFTFRQTLEKKIEIQMNYLEECGLKFDTNIAAIQVLSDLYDHTVAETRRSRDVLLKLKERYPMVLVSNFYGNISTVLEEFELNHIFSHIIESAVVGVRKPDPRIFTLGVEALGLPASEVVVVGDSMDKDIVPARKAGCQAIWFKGEGWTDDVVDETLASRVIMSLSELLQ